MSAGDALMRFAAAGENDLLRLVSTASTVIGTSLFTALALEGYSVRPAHVPVFAGLDPTGTNISTLATRAGISRQAMSGLVRDVESAGYVRTTPDPSDKRALVVELIELAQQWRLKLGSERFEALLDDLRAIGIRPQRDCRRVHRVMAG